MPKKKNQGERPRRGSTVKRDAIEGIELELIVLYMDVDELNARILQALRRSPVVRDVLLPALERVIQMQMALDHVKDYMDAAWLDEQDNWRV